MGLAVEVGDIGLGKIMDERSVIGLCGIGMGRESEREAPLRIGESGVGSHHEEVGRGVVSRFDNPTHLGIGDGKAVESASGETDGDAVALTIGTVGHSHVDKEAWLLVFFDTDAAFEEEEGVANAIGFPHPETVRARETVSRQDKARRSSAGVVGEEGGTVDSTPVGVEQFKKQAARRQKVRRSVTIGGVGEERERHGVAQAVEGSVEEKSIGGIDFIIGRIKIIDLLFYNIVVDAGLKIARALVVARFVVGQREIALVVGGERGDGGGYAALFADQRKRMVGDGGTGNGVEEIAGSGVALFEDDEGTLASKSREMEVGGVETRGGGDKEDVVSSR